MSLDLEWLFPLLCDMGLFILEPFSSSIFFRLCFATLRRFSRNWELGTSLSLDLDLDPSRFLRLDLPLDGVLAAIGRLRREDLLDFGLDSFFLDRDLDFDLDFERDLDLDFSCDRRIMLCSGSSLLRLFLVETGFTSIFWGWLNGFFGLELEIIDFGPNLNLKI